MSIPPIIIADIRYIQIQSNTEKAPIKWNRLDINLRSCESTPSFKTHLFIIAYEL